MLGIAWWFHLIHAPVSDYVGANFPWPAKGSVLFWPALLAEAVFIEAVVCLPVAVFLAAVLRPDAAAMAIGLASLFALRVVFEFFDRDISNKMRLLGLFKIASHALLLVGATLYVRQILLRRRGVGNEP